MTRRIPHVLGLVAVSAVGVLAVAACAQRSPAEVTTQPSVTGAPILGGSPSSPPTGGPVTSPPPPGPPSPPPGNGGGGPTPEPGGGGSASSTLASKAGFVWNSDASSSHAATGPYQYNSAGGAITIIRSGVGRYTVVFAGLGDNGGVAHAQAYGDTPNYCAVGFWTGLGGDQRVVVSCYNPAGAYADTRFVANWAAGSQGTAQFGYLWANEPTNDSVYHPASTYRYDALSTADMTVQRLSTGRYRVHIPVSALDEPAAPWAYQVTAYGSNNLCKLHSVDLGAGNAVVACRTPAGVNANSQFSITYDAFGSMIGRLDRPSSASGKSVAGVPSNFGGAVANPAVGVYLATLDGLGQPKGHVVALGTGTSSTYCHISSWSDIGSDLRARVVCFSPGGAPAASGFTLSATL